MFVLKIYFFVYAARIAHCESHLCGKTIIKIKTFTDVKIMIAHSSLFLGPIKVFLWIENK